MPEKRIRRSNIPAGVVLLKNDSYDTAIAGITEDGRAVYDYEKMLRHLMDGQNMTEEQAVDWISYNTIRALPNSGPAGPIIMYPLFAKITE